MKEKIDLWKTDNEILRIFSSRIKERRLKNNLNQAELGKEIGLSTRSITNIENGNGFSFINFIKLVRFFSDLDALDQVLNVADLSPSEQFMSKKSADRQRARKKKLHD